MQNKGVIVFLTVIITALCLYYLSFTLVSNGVQQKANEYATDASGNVDFAKRRAYLDSVWRQPVYNFLGVDFTYQEIKETELGLGLDLQGGMHVTLEVSPVEILRALSGKSNDPNFEKALASASKLQATSTKPFNEIGKAEQIKSGQWSNKAERKSRNGHRAGVMQFMSNDIHRSRITHRGQHHQNGLPGNLKNGSIGIVQNQSNCSGQS